MMAVASAQASQWEECRAAYRTISGKSNGLASLKGGLRLGRSMSRAERTRGHHDYLIETSAYRCPAITNMQ